MRGELRCLSVCLAIFLDGLLVLLPSFSSLLPLIELRPLSWVHRVSSVVDDRIFLLLVAQARHEHDNLIYYAIDLYHLMKPHNLTGFLFHSTVALSRPLLSLPDE